MTVITPLHVKHTLIARTTAMRAAAVLDASDYPQVAFQVRQGNLGMLDVVRPLL